MMTNTKLFIQSERSPFMMSFVYITEKGRAIIIDGGRPEDMPHLREIIGDCPIAAWILTHPHMDHIWGFIEEMKKGELLARTEQIYYNFPSEEFVLACDQIESEENGWPLSIIDFNRALPIFADKTTIVKPGLTVQVDELTVEFLFCGEERYRIPPRPNFAVNESSIVFKVTGPGIRSVLFLADLGPCGGRDLLAECKDKLPSDIVQMAHHGHSGVPEEVYRVINPTACLWCCPDWLWEEEDYEIEPELWGTKHQRKWMERLGVTEHYITKDGTQSVPLTKE